MQPALAGLPNLVERSAERVLVVGDIHGSVLAMRYIEAMLDEHSFELVIFLGDYVDREKHREHKALAFG